MVKRDKILTEIRKELMDKLVIQKSTLSSMITKLVNSLPLSLPREYATYIMAKENDINLPITEEKREKLNQYLIQIAGLKPVIKAKQATEEKPKRKASKTAKAFVINIGKFSLKKTNLNPNRIKEAYESAEIYFYLNIFENSIRFFILDIMNKNHGIDWWNDIIKENIQEYVVKVKKNREKGWLRKEEPHQIFYTTFGQLIEIIEQNWKDFEPIFVSIDNLKWFIKPIKDIRNPIAHNNLISKNSKKLLLQHIQQWFDYMDILPI